MTITEKRATNEKMLENSLFGYEHIHTFCNEEGCTNEATHAYVSRFDFVMWICESCIIEYQVQVVIE
tara:strand:- start:204 stop:404 length:201 start_codon:yes stop_codon:yes gene_type:complete